MGFRSQLQTALIFLLILTVLMLYIYWENYNLLKQAAEGGVEDPDLASLVSKLNLFLFFIVLVEALLGIGILGIAPSMSHKVPPEYRRGFLRQKDLSIY